MSVQKRGDGWAVEIDRDVMIWEFLPDMELSAFREQAYPVYEELIQNHDVDGMVTVVNLDDPFGPNVFEVWEESAQAAERAGMKRWAVVADGIKKISLRGKIDTSGLETMTTEDRTAAVEWVHEA
jgi:hypothetical protein